MVVAALGATMTVKSLTLGATVRATVLECTRDSEVAVIVTVVVAVGVAAEVPMVSVELAALLPGLTDAGLNEHVAPAGNPKQENDRALLKLLVGCAVTA